MRCTICIRKIDFNGDGFFSFCHDLVRDANFICRSRRIKIIIRVIDDFGRCAPAKDLVLSIDKLISPVGYRFDKDRHGCIVHERLQEAGCPSKLAGPFGDECFKVGI